MLGTYRHSDYRRTNPRRISELMRHDELHLSDRYSGVAPCGSEST